LSWRGSLANHPFQSQLQILGELSHRLLAFLTSLAIPFPPLCQRPDPLILQVANDGQTEIRLDVGEVAQVAQSEVVYDELGRMSSRQLTRETDFRSLAKPPSPGSLPEPICLARLHPPGRAGEDRVRIEFAVDGSRRLLATVTDLHTQQLLADAQPVATLS